MEKYLTWYKEIIKKNGIKNTIQKEVVLNVLIKASSHNKFGLYQIKPKS